MSISNVQLPFNQRFSKFDTRNAPSKYRLSDLGFRFEMSEGVRPAEYVAPYRYLPVAYQDTTTQDYIVIPKGRVVSMLSTEDATPLAGLTTPAASGSYPIGFMAPEMGRSGISVSIDSSFFGYDEFINGLLVLANGGSTCSGFYTAEDVTAGTIKANGANAAANDAFTLTGNLPVGVAYHDWYQDIAGKNLNYRMWPDGGHFLTDWFVEVPYVKVATSGTYSGVNPGYANTYANLTKWQEVNKKFTYLTVNTESGDSFRPGTLVASDLIGNYKLQSNSLTAAVTAQTVGKVVGIDCRFPKSGLEDVQTYPRSGMPGTQTAGMPKFLFDFVYQCILIGTGTAPTVEGVYNAIRSGAFGLVRINLSIS